MLGLPVDGDGDLAAVLVLHRGILARFLQPGQRGFCGDAHGFRGLRCRLQVERPSRTHVRGRHGIAVFVYGGDAIGQGERVMAVVTGCLRNGQGARTPGLGCGIVGELGIAVNRDVGICRFGTQHGTGIGVFYQLFRQGIVLNLRAFKGEVVFPNAVLIQDHPDGILGPPVGSRIVNVVVAAVRIVPPLQRRRALLPHVHIERRLVEVGGNDLLVGQAGGAFSVRIQLAYFQHEVVQLGQVLRIVIRVIAIGEGRVAHRVREVGADGAGGIELFVEFGLGDVVD